MSIHVVYQKSKDGIRALQPVVKRAQRRGVLWRIKLAPHRAQKVD